MEVIPSQVFLLKAGEKEVNVLFDDNEYFCINKSMVFKADSAKEIITKIEADLLNFSGDIFIEIVDLLQFSKFSQTRLMLYLSKVSLSKLEAERSGTEAFNDLLREAKKMQIDVFLL